MKILLRVSTNNITVNIDPYWTPELDEFGTSPSIDIYKTTFPMSDKLAPAIVNWSALGSVSPKEARQFAKALLRAAHIANRLDSDKLSPERDYAEEIYCNKDVDLIQAIRYDQMEARNEI